MVLQDKLGEMVGILGIGACLAFVLNASELTVIQETNAVFLTVVRIKLHSGFSFENSS